MDMENDKWLILLLSLGLGLLVGMQRESAKSKTAGIRTFPLITLTGTVCGLLAKEFDAWILAVGLLAITLLLVVGNLHRMKKQRRRIRHHYGNCCFIHVWHRSLPGLWRDDDCSCPYWCGNSSSSF